MGKNFCLLSLAGLVVGITVLIATPTSQGFPEPSAAVATWRLDWTHGKPEPIAVKTPDGQTRWFWYITYKVTNNSGQERLFIPEFTIASDAGDILPAGKDVPAGVFEAIKDHLGNRLLENPITVVGRLLQGEDNAKESVIVWPAFDHDIDAASIFITGLSGETQVVEHPTTHEPLTMRRTLMLCYSLPGTGGDIQKQTVLPRGEKWVMR